MSRPAERNKSRYGWLPDTVGDMLRNVAYVGKTWSAGRKRAARANDGGELIPARWPAIIDEATFRQAQDRLAEQGRRRRSPARPGAFSAYWCALGVVASCGASRTGISLLTRARGDMAQVM